MQRDEMHKGLLVRLLSEYSNVPTGTWATVDSTGIMRGRRLVIYRQVANMASATSAMVCAAMSPREILPLRLTSHPTRYIVRDKALLSPFRGVALICKLWPINL